MSSMSTDEVRLPTQRSFVTAMLERGAQQSPLGICIIDDETNTKLTYCDVLSNVSCLGNGLKKSGLSVEGRIGNIFYL